MAKTDNLQDYLTDLANAIREKKGTTGLINPQDFASEIASIETGGDGGGIRSSWRYFDVSKMTGASPGQFLPTIVRYSEPMSIVSALGVETDKWKEVKAVGVDGDGLAVFVDKQPYTWNEAMAVEGLTPEVMAQLNIVEITEEEFLNNTFTKE